MENAPPEEKPLMAMVSGLMLSLSSAEPEAAASGPVTTFVGKNISGLHCERERKKMKHMYC